MKYLRKLCNCFFFFADAFCVYVIFIILKEIRKKNNNDHWPLPDTDQTLVIVQTTKRGKNDLKLYFDKSANL